MHMHIYTDMHTYTCVHIHRYMYVYMHVCAWPAAVSPQLCKYTYVYICSFVYVYTFTYICILVYIRKAIPDIKHKLIKEPERLV